MTPEEQRISDFDIHHYEGHREKLPFKKQKQKRAKQYTISLKKAFYYANLIGSPLKRKNP